MPDKKAAKKQPVKRALVENDPPKYDQLPVLPSKEGGQPPALSPRRVAPKPLTDAQSKTESKSRTRRSEWEASTVGQARVTNLQEHHNTKISLGMLHALRSDHDMSARSTKPGIHDVQLPGMGDPNAAPRPPRWEELPTEAQAHTHRALAALGTDIDQVKNDLGAQYDQATVRADRHRQAPHAEDFYEPDGPARKVMDAAVTDSRGNRSATPREMAAEVSIHSPNNVFVQKSSSTGELAYPNVDTAAHTIDYQRSGGKAEDIPNKPSPDSPNSFQGYPENKVKGVHALNQSDAGALTSEWKNQPSKSNPEGSSMWGPKTGPFNNMFSTHDPSYLPSDIHTGGGGALPHLGSEKRQKYDAEGNPKRKKNGTLDKGPSEREAAISSVPYFHSMADHAARNAMQDRGLTDMQKFQGAEWGEEQVQRGAQGGVAERDVYGPSRTSKIIPHNPNQGSLF